MRYYSEQLDKFFNTEKECIEAEKELEKKAELEKKQKDEKLANDQKLKKELAKKVEEAESKLTEAYDNFQNEKNRADTLLKNAKKEYENILEAAATKIRSAEKDKMKAVEEFNNKFGVYSKVYNGEKAARELSRINALLNNVFNYDYYRHFWW